MFFHKMKKILDNNHGDTTSGPIKNDTVLHENCVLNDHLSSQTSEDDVILTETDAKLTAADDEYVSVENSCKIAFSPYFRERGCTFR